MGDTTKRIRLVLVDDHKVVLSGIKAVLQHSARIEVVGDALNGEAAVRLCLQTSPDMVLLDIRLGKDSGVEVCQRLKTLTPPPRVLVLTSYADDALVIDALAAGADGYLLKDIDGDELIQSIEKVASGSAVLDSTVTRKVIERMQNPEPVSRPGSMPNLGQRELQVLRLVAQGATNKEISKALKITEGTVRNYLTTIFLKLGVSRRTQATAIYLRMAEASKSPATKNR